MGRVGTVRVSTGILSDNNAASGAPTVAANGVAVPDGQRGEYAHFIAAKANVATFSLWGYHSQVAAWVEVERMNFTHEGNESQLLRGVTSYDRVCEQRLDANVANTGVTTYWGFSE